MPVLALKLGGLNRLLFFVKNLQVCLKLFVNVSNWLFGLYIWMAFRNDKGTVWLNFYIGKLSFYILALKGHTMFTFRYLLFFFWIHVFWHHKQQSEFNPLHIFLQSVKWNIFAAIFKDWKNCLKNWSRILPRIKQQNKSSLLKVITITLSFKLKHGVSL